MFNIIPTKSFTGMTISGDYKDFETLLDAIYDLADIEVNNGLGYGNATEHFLRLAHDIRHASRGESALNMVENGTKEGRNLYFGFSVSMIRFFFDIILMDELIKLRCDYVAGKEKSTFVLEKDKKSHLVVVEESQIKSIDGKELEENHLLIEEKLRLNKSIGLVQYFAAKAYFALSKVIGLEEVEKLQILHKEELERKSGKIFIEFLLQYVEELEMEYLKTEDSQKRAEILPEILERLITKGKNGRYREMEKEIIAQAEKEEIPVDAVKYEYDFDWKKLEW